jgi:hypothetical protein
MVVIASKKSKSEKTENRPIPDATVNGGGIVLCYGVNKIKLSAKYAGKRIDDIIEKAEGLMNLPTDYVVAAAVNGKMTDTNKRIQKGDIIEFIKTAGEKGI